MRPTLRLALVLPALIAVLTLPSFVAPAAAEEGMWIPLQIPGLVSTLKQKGFAGDSNAFADLTGHPMGAIISLGGCSASFISPDGLIATNHHCAQGALQYNSTPDRDLIENGFLASDRASELWNGPGARVSVTVGFREVTDEIVGGLDPTLDGLARHDEIERRVKARTAQCEKDGLRCRVESFFERLRWYEQAQMEIEDVRLVYAPPASVGNFGGEIDNWQWPRHTGDWTLFRAWVDPKGKPAPHSKKNVPYKPKQWLKVSTRGASPGQLVFVAGYPGSTSRHAIAAEIREQVEWDLPRRIRLSKEQLDLLEGLSKDDRELGIKVTQKVRGLANGMKNAEGTLAGLVAGGALAIKEGREKALAAWIDADPARKAKWGAALPALAGIQAATERFRERDATFRALFRASALLSAADMIHRNSIERTKKDSDREPEFQDRDQARIREKLERMEKSFAPKADRALLRWAVRKAQQLPADVRIAPLDQAVGLRPGQPDAETAAAIDAWLDRLYAGTKLGETKARLAWLDPKRKTKEVVGAQDTFLDLAVGLHPVGESLRNEAKARDGRRFRHAPLYMEALLQKEGGRVAPDANGTLRFTFGSVEGWQPRDGLFYLPQTTLRGVVAKHTNAGDFDVPDRVLEASRRLHAGGTSPYVDPKLGDLPVCYLSTVDTTGGNSGSATLDDKWEFCGLLFDGLMESLSSDVVFDERANRSIHVDSRYLLWTLAEVEKATHLLKEMGIE